MLDNDAIQQLRSFEEQRVLPLLDEMGAEAIRDSKFELTLLPGAIAFLVNNADAYQRHQGQLHWQPLSVVYCDADDRKGEVFALHARFDPTVERGCFVSAEICGVLWLIQEGELVTWRNPIDGKQLLQFRDEPQKLLRNAWYLFRGAIMPMLYHNTYRFMETEADRYRFQAQMIHQIQAVYRGTIP